MKKLFTLVIVSLASLTVANAQWAGGITDDAYLKGTKTEVGVSDCGSFGTLIPPATSLGYHNNVAGRGLGFVADAGSNGWTIAGPGGLPPYCGDYFLPGTPVEGWGVQIGMTHYRNFNNSSICEMFGIPGGMICYSSTPARRSATWQSTGLVGGSLRVTNTTYVPDTALFFVTQVKLCNESALPVNDVYYLRHLDPDNDQPWSAYSGSFTTRNLIYSQGSDTTPGLVTATSRSGCYLGIGSESPVSRVTHGGFSPPTLASDVWNAVPPYVSTVGTAVNEDAAISIAFKFLTIAPGTCECFGYAHVLDLADLDRALALTATNVAIYKDTVEITDSLYLYICAGDTSTHKFKAVTTCTDLYTINWTADPPGSIIGPTTYDSITVAPTVNTVYTMFGEGPCGSDTFQIHVIIDSMLYSLAITPSDSLICKGESTSIDVTGTGTYTYTWGPGSGMGTASSTTVSPVSTTIYSAAVTTTLAGCVDTLYSNIRVDTLKANAGRDTNLCPGRMLVLGGSPTSSRPFPVAWTAIPSGALAFLSSASDTNPTLVFPLGEPAGVYSFSVLSSNYGCVARDTIDVTLPASSPITITIDSIYCVTDPGDIITATPYGGTFSGPGVTDSTFRPTVAGAGGPYSIVYTYLTAAGCLSIDSTPTYVASLPTAVFIGLASTYCVTDSSVALVGAPGGGLFSGPGMSGNIFYPNTAGVGGPYNIRYTYTHPVTGCVDDTVQQVTVTGRPTASFTGLSTQYCFYEPNDTLTGSPAGGTFSGPGISGNIFSPSAAGVGGPYNIIYTYSTGAACSGSDTQSVTVNARPVLNFVGLNTQYCFYETPDTLTGVPAGGTFSGPGISGNVFNPATAGIGGPYSIIYNYTEPATGCTNADTQLVTVNNRPGVTFSGLAANYCVNSPVATLTGVPSGGTFSGAGISGTGFDPAVAGAGGPYMITYSYTSPTTGCSNIDSQYVTVNALPTPSFSGLNSSYCIYEPAVVLSGTPSGGTFSGPGMVDSSFTPSGAGVGGPYRILYSYTSPVTGCSNVDSQFTRVNARPAINITGLASHYCINAAAVGISATPAGGTFSGPGISGSTFDPAAAGIGGPYYIVYAVNDPITGCFNKDSVATRVDPLPTPYFTGLNTAYCVNSPAATLTGIPSGGTFSGPGITGSTFTPSVAGAGGPYSIRYLYTDPNGCVEDTFRSTTVNALPLANAGPDDTICLGNGIMLTATGGVTYSWSPGGGAVASIFVSPSVNTTYTVTVTDINNCSASDNVTISIKIITMSFIKTDISCNGANDGIVVVRPTSGIPPYSYAWSDPSHQTNDTATNLAPGTYQVTVTDGDLCTGIDRVTITEPPVLMAFATPTNTLCYGDSTGTVRLSGSGGTPPYSYRTTSDGIYYYTGSTIIGLPAGIYSTEEKDAHGCIANTSFTITQPTPIVMSYQDMQPRCYGYSDGSIFVLATGGTPIYTMQMDGEVNSTGWFIDLAAGNHSLSIVDANGCTEHYTIALAQPAPIIVDINPDSLLLDLGETGQLFTTFTGAPSDSVIFQWNTDNGMSCTDCPNPIVSPYTDQVYEVTVIDVSDPSNPKPCTGSAIGYVFVNDGQPVYIPNSFTPNGDGVNDKFYIYGKSLKTIRMQVFDRWGELLFTSYSQDNGWDGTYRGANMEPGVYVYTVEAEYLNGKTINQTGSVTLIR